MSAFKQRLASVVRLPSAQINPHQFNRLATFSLSIGRHGSVDVETPLWIFVVHLEAIDHLGRIDGQFFLQL